MAVVIVGERPNAQRLYQRYRQLEVNEPATDIGGNPIGGGGTGTVPLTNDYFVDGGRRDLYTPDGTFLKPFKTITDALSLMSTRITADTWGTPQVVHIAPGQYAENLSIPAGMVHFFGNFRLKGNIQLNRNPVMCQAATDSFTGSWSTDLMHTFTMTAQTPMGQLSNQGQPKAAGISVYGNIYGSNVSDPSCRAPLSNAYSWMNVLLSGVFLDGTITPNNAAYPAAPARFTSQVNFVLENSAVKNIDLPLSFDGNTTDFCNLDMLGSSVFGVIADRAGVTGVLCFKSIRESMLRKLNVISGYITCGVYNADYWFNTTISQEIGYGISNLRILPGTTWKGNATSWKSLSRWESFFTGVFSTVVVTDLSKDALDALDAANAPSRLNPFVTMADIASLTHPVATNVTFFPTTEIPANNVQQAIEMVQSHIIRSFTAEEITFDPQPPEISSVNVQAATEEVNDKFHLIDGGQF